MAELAVYLHSLGTVVRCRHCTAILMTFVEIRGVVCVDLGGLAGLKGLKAWRRTAQRRPLTESARLRPGRVAGGVESRRRRRRCKAAPTAPAKAAVATPDSTMIATACGGRWKP